MQTKLIPYKGIVFIHNEITDMQKGRIPENKAYRHLLVSQLADMLYRHARQDSGFEFSMCFSSDTIVEATLRLPIDLAQLQRVRILFEAQENYYMCTWTITRNISTHYSDFNSYSASKPAPPETLCDILPVANDGSELLTNILLYDQQLLNEILDALLQNRKIVVRKR